MRFKRNGLECYDNTIAAAGRWGMLHNATCCHCMTSCCAWAKRGAFGEDAAAASTAD